MLSIYEMTSWKKKIIGDQLSKSFIDKIKSKNIPKPELVQKYGNLVASKNILNDLKNNKTNLDAAENNKKVRFKIYHSTK